MKNISVSLQEDLYESLRYNASSMGISKFVSLALKEKIEKENKILADAYDEASKDKDREEVLKDWDAIGSEVWD